MEVLSILLVIAIVIIIVLFSQLSYKNHCIEDLENRLSKESERKNKNFVDILNKLKEYQNFESASRDTCTRRLINQALQEYSNTNSMFDRVLKEACKIYAKKELNISTTNENV